jgi:hypothetical protein
MSATTKATIKANGLTVKVEYAGYMSYYITIDGTAIECYDNLSQAVASANRIATLGMDELIMRQNYGQHGSYLLS